MNVGSVKYKEGFFVFDLGQDKLALTFGPVLFCCQKMSFCCRMLAKSSTAETLGMFRAVLSSGVSARRNGFVDFSRLMVEGVNGVPRLFECCSWWRSCFTVSLLGCNVKANW